LFNTNIVVALQAEARPLIDHFRLKKVDDTSGFHCYRDVSRHLVISGHGTIAAAAAVGWLAARAPPNSAWINIGMAGHTGLPLETPFIAVEIADRVTEQRWYPPQVIKTGLVPSILTTVHAPETQYAGTGGFDMEACAFVPCARRFTTSELVQCLKVVSDNPESPVERKSAEWVSALMSARLAEITDYLSAFAGLGELLPVSQASIPDEMFEKWHFTSTQRSQFRDAWTKWGATYGESPAGFIRGGRFNTSRQLIEAMKMRLAGTVPVIRRPIGHG
jgi:hypothetical protein